MSASPPHDHAPAHGIRRSARHGGADGDAGRAKQARFSRGGPEQFSLTWT
jgi:hypothetical protein